jgi:hypothetical protein
MNSGQYPKIKKSVYGFPTAKEACFIKLKAALP